MDQKKFDESKSFFIQGLNKLENKNYAEAKNFFNLSLKLIPDRFSTMNNLAISLIALKDIEKAENLADKIINLFPDNEEGYLLKGKILHEKKFFDESIKLLKKALEINSNSIEAHNAIGFVYKTLEKFSDSLHHCQKSIQINPNQNFVYGDYLKLKMELCDWENLSINTSDLISRINDKNIIYPFVLLHLIDDSSLLLKASKAYSKFISPIVSKKEIKFFQNKKIKIGYYSSDFRNHPVYHLIIGMLEKHNKDQFEIYLFSFVPTSEDYILNRIKNTNHKYIDVSKISNEEIVALSKNLEIDIAVDLNGHTLNSRPEIFEIGCASIQVNYLGYPGTTGSDSIDYIIADKIVIPIDSQKNFSENIIYLPNSYQANDSNRSINLLNFTKEELALPKDHFIFCCFNNKSKITPQVFDNWMNILKNVNNSIIWLLGSDNEISSQNLKNEAKKRNIDPSRLIFAPRAEYKYYLSRYQCADLFLDTFPFNAHTTASDALWSGIPVLTLQGKSFASRVASSLLSAIGLPELITYTYEDYKNKAIEIANSNAKLNEIKKKLKFNKNKQPLFDTDKYTKNLESAYKLIFDRHQKKEKPDNFEIIDI